MAKTLTRNPSVPTTLKILVHDRTGRTVTIAGAGPWTGIDDTDALRLMQARVNVGGVLLQPFT